MQILNTNRASYRKERAVHSGCFFCDPKVIRTQECTLLKFTHWYVLANKYPYMNGNVMLVPKQHRTKLKALSENEWQEFPEALEATQKVLTELLDTDSFNIGINEGKHSGRSVPHLHWQVIPRVRKNHTAVSVLADIHVITLSPWELKKKLSDE